MILCRFHFKYIIMLLCENRQEMCNIKSREIIRRFLSGPASWVHDLSCLTRLPLQKGSALGLMLCWLHFEVLNSFLTRGLTCLFCLGLPNYVTGCWLLQKSSCKMMLSYTTMIMLGVEKRDLCFADEIQLESNIRLPPRWALGLVHVEHSDCLYNINLRWSTHIPSI